MTFDTLQYIDSSGATQEVALSTANLASTGGALPYRLDLRSHAASTCTITWVQPPETGIAIPFKSRCLVYLSRTSSTGAANSFSGGTILFQGRRTDNPGSASATKILSTITLSDAWWDLAKITYQVGANVITGGTIASPTFTPFYWPDIVLFQAAPGATYSPAAVNGTITTWQQLQAIINFATGFYSGTDAVQLQLGSTAEFTPLYCNWYPMRSAKCAEALQVCLRPHPGVFTEIDYTTTPPTIHFRNRTAMTPTTLPYKSTYSGITHIATDIESLDQLVPDAVRLYYKVTGTFNGQSVVNFQTDFYPASAPNSLLCLDYSIDVTGAALSQTVCHFTSSTFDPTALALWRQKLPSLHQISEGGQIVDDGSPGALTLISSGTYDPSTNPKGIQVIGDDGTDYSSSYGTVIPYITDNPIYTWFNLSGATAMVVKATVKAFFSYNKITTAGSGTLTDVMGEHQHSMRVLLTNVPTGEYVLNQVLNDGEAIPAGLAQALYTELQVLQWKLKHEIIQVAPDTTTVPTLIKPGKNCINLSGGATAWETMNAVPESVTIQFFRTAAGRLVARHSISCGPVNHLEPGYIVQLTNLFVNRNKSGIDAKQRLTGTMSSNQSDLSATGNKENSVPAPPVPVATNHAYVNSGAIKGQIALNAQTIANLLAATTPTPYTGFSASDLLLMEPREIKVCDDSGNPYYIIVLCTGGYTKP